MKHAVEGLNSPALRRGHTYSTRKQTSSGFGAVLQQELARADERQTAFPKHTITQAGEHGITVTPTLLDQPTDSVERTQVRGATNILILDQSLTFIISVPHSQVITALSQGEMKGNIFTNINGAMIL